MQATAKQGCRSTKIRGDTLQTANLYAMLLLRAFLQNEDGEPHLLRLDQMIQYALVKTTCRKFYCKDIDNMARLRQLLVVISQAGVPTAQ